MPARRTVDISLVLALPQKHAARILGTNPSSLSKGWKAASNGRRWPYREISKLDDMVVPLLKQIISRRGDNEGDLTTLRNYLKKRLDILAPPVFIILNDNQ